MNTKNLKEKKRRDVPTVLEYLPNGEKAVGNAL